MHIREQIRQAVATATGVPLGASGELMAAPIQHQVDQPSEEVETEEKLTASGNRVQYRRVLIIIRSTHRGESVNAVIQSTADDAVGFEADVAGMDISGLADLVELVGTEIEILADEPKQTIAAQQISYIFHTRTLTGLPETKV